MRKKVIRRLALAELIKADRIAELADHQQRKVRELEQESEMEVATAIQQCYRHVFYPSRRQSTLQNDTTCNYLLFCSSCRIPNTSRTTCAQSTADCHDSCQHGLSTRQVNGSHPAQTAACVSSTESPELC